MSLSSVCVVSNALRLKLFKPRFQAERYVDSSVQIPAAENPDGLHKNDKGEITMMRLNKTIMIEGMSCGHCSERVEKALNALEGVEAVVDLANKKATISVTGKVSDDELKKAVREAGYSVISLQVEDSL
jgi:Cu+-exporting ATPase